MRTHAAILLALPALLALCGYASVAGQDETPALPETMTEAVVIDFVAEHEISTVEAFIAALPRLHKRHFVAVHDSASPAADFVSVRHPRIVSWGADSTFILTWTTDPDDPRTDAVEFLQAVPDEGRWTAGIIDFSGDSATVRHPETCAQCHSDLNRPLWGASHVHAGTENESLAAGTTEDSQALAVTMLITRHPRLSPLERTEYTFLPRYIAFADRQNQNPNWEFAGTLALRHAEVLFNRLLAREDYDQLARSLACAPSLRDRVRDLFDQQHFNIRLLSDTLQGAALLRRRPQGLHASGTARAT